LGLQGFELKLVEPLIAASLVVAGLLVVTKMQLQGIWAAALAGVFAIFHGLAHGHELADNAQAFEVLAGLVCATVLLHGTGLFLGRMLRGAPSWIPRSLGAAVALLGSTLLLPLN
jgi:urease accessory protein